MTHFPHSASHFPDSDHADAQRPRAPGTAIASIIVSAVGFCVPLLGIIGIGLGVVGFMQAMSRRAGAVVAAIGTVLGVITTIPWVLLLGALLVPAFPGYEPVRRFASLGFATTIAQKIMDEARANGGQYPPPGTDFEAMISPNDIPPFMWGGAFDSDQPAFLLVYESLEPPYRPTWIMLNPDIDAAAQIPVIGFATDQPDQIELVERGEAVRLIGDAHLFTTDGRPWTLSGPVP